MMIKKKFLLLVLSLALVVSAIACQVSTPTLAEGGRGGSAAATATQAGAEQGGSAPILTYSFSSPTPLPSVDHVPSTALFFPPMNAVAQSGQWTIAILGWGVVNSLTDVQPASGMKFLEVDVVLLNRGSKWDWSPMNGSVEVKDVSSGQEYFLSGAFDPRARFNPAFGMLPGEHDRGLLIFEVPLASEKWIFMFSPDSQDVASIPLVQGGSVGSLPSEMTTYDSGAHELKDTVTLGDLAVTVTGWQNQIVSGVDNVTVDTLVTNLSQNSYFGNDSGDFIFGLKDVTGQFYEGYPVTPEISSFWPDNAILLAPGETADIRTKFAIPEDTAEWELYVIYHGQHKRFPSEPEFPKLNEGAFWKLGSHPTDLGIPSNIPGKLTPTLHPLGEAAQVDAFTINVTDVSVKHKAGGYGSFQESGTLLTVKYRAQFTGTPPAEYSDIPVTSNSIKAYIKNGKGHYFDPRMSTYNDTSLKPGETVDMQTTFFVPDESDEYYLVIEYIYGLHKAFFALK